MQAMLLKLSQQQGSDKIDNKKFVAFVNERDFMGVLLGSNRHSKALRASEVDSNLALIENLKKSMREYLFDKKFKKMTEKLKRINRELDRKDEDYSPKIDDCLQVTNSCAVFSRNRDDRHLEFYVDLHQQLNAKVQDLKSEIAQKKSDQHRRYRSQLCESVQSTGSRNMQVIQKRISRAKNKENIHIINKQSSKGARKQSELMINFTNQGLKYRELVRGHKLNPWSKWYVKEELELFPGKRVSIRKLQKSIY